MTTQKVPFDIPPPDVLRQMREELGLSQHELAAALGFKMEGVRAVRGWEDGIRMGAPCKPSPLAWRCFRLMLVAWRATRGEKSAAWDYVYDNLPEAMR